MDSILQSIEDWFRELLVSGIMNNLTNTFDSVNNQVGQIATEVGRTPANFSPAVYNMIRTLSENVIMPIAGLILTFIACYELIQLVISHNNLANFETWIFWKWIFKTFVAVQLTDEYNMNLNNYYSVYVNDKYGDLGLVGAIIVSGHIIDLFCLSCRALGREVEARMVEFLLDEHNIQEIKFSDTYKNKELKEYLSDYFIVMDTKKTYD